MGGPGVILHALYGLNGLHKGLIRNLRGGGPQIVL